MECEGKCYTCITRGKSACNCGSMAQCTKIATKKHENNKGTKFAYTLYLCGNCSKRDLWALDNSSDSMGIAESFEFK